MYGIPGAPYQHAVLCGMRAVATSWTFMQRQLPNSAKVCGDGNAVAWQAQGSMLTRNTYQDAHNRDTQVPCCCPISGAQKSTPPQAAGGCTHDTCMP